MNLRRRRFTFIVLGGAVALCAGLVGARAAGLPILATSTAAHPVSAEHVSTAGRPAADDTAHGGTDASEAPEATETPEASENDQGENEQQAPPPAHSDSPDSQEHDSSSGSSGGDGASPSGPR